jgi:ubiquinone biosynthesis protein UbiJ
MQIQSPFSVFETLLKNFKPPFALPVWAVEESHRRVVLLLNHVLKQEPQAMERLARCKSNVVLCQWREFTFQVVITPVGLFDLATQGAVPDLKLELTQDSPIAMVGSILKGEKPTVRIDGDVQLAAEVNWLADHVRWDVEEDLAHIVGDAPANLLVQMARTLSQALGQFVGQRNPL